MPLGDEQYDALEFTKEELQQEMRSNYDELLDFFFSDEFQKVWTDLKAMSSVERHGYVKRVLLNKDVLKSERGIDVPENILIQRSAFGDRRPTLFCLKKYLPEKYHCVWENTNLTFDEEFDDITVSRDNKVSWRAPIRPDIQALLVGVGFPLEEVPDTFRVAYDSDDPV